MIGGYGAPYGKVNIGPGFFESFSQLAQTGVAVGGGLAAQRQQTLQALAQQEATQAAAGAQTTAAMVQAQAQQLASRTTLILGIAGIVGLLVLGGLGLFAMRRRRR